MFRIITAFDSWHLNGVHCPSLKVGRSANTLQEAIRLYNESNYKLDNYTDEKRQPLTSEYLESKFDRYYTRIVAFDGGREGEVVINKDFED